MIKAILLDIDGTLTNDKKEITPRTKEALMKAQKAGIRLALVSARTENGLKRFGRQLSFESNHGIYIACNGGLIKDAQNGEVYYEKSMPAELASEILEHLKKFDVIPMITKGEYMYTGDVFKGMIHTNMNEDSKMINIIEYESRSNEYMLCEKKDMAAFADFPMQKILVAGEPIYLRDHAEEMSAPFQERTSCGFTAPVYYEFNAKGVQKAKAVETAFTSLGISSDEMMAFGDQKNDISMLTYAKYGIAMGNAIQEAKDAAYDVTLSNNEDGIAAAIEKYIPELR
jgi:Cof subfamily protein (haloacid dehalogenase superfamily)